MNDKQDVPPLNVIVGFGNGRVTPFDNARDFYERDGYLFVNGYGYPFGVFAPGQWQWAIASCNTQKREEVPL